MELLEHLEPREKMDWMELQDLKGQRETLVPLVSLFHRKSQALPVHPAIQAKTELLVLPAVPDLLAPSDQLDFKALLAKMVLRVAKALLDPREMLEKRVTMELPVKMEFQVPQARNLALLDPREMLDHQEMTALPVKMEPSAL
jgi:hypothetical protein